MDAQALLYFLTTAALPILFAITVHEYAHGWVADKCGDRSARMLGRLTLNPVKHIDPIGTLLVPCFLALTTPLIFGWAKPVPINTQALKRRSHLALIAFAGPASNILMAFLWLALLKYRYFLPNNIDAMARIGVHINLVLAILNLIPLPPLDGSRCVSALLPGRLSYYYDQLEPYGLWILVIMLFLGILSDLISGPYIIANHFLYSLI